MGFVLNPAGGPKHGCLLSGLPKTTRPSDKHWELHVCGCAKMSASVLTNARASTTKMESGLRSHQSESGFPKVSTLGAMESFCKKQKPPLGWDVSLPLKHAMIQGRPVQSNCSITLIHQPEKRAKVAKQLQVKSL